MIRASLKSLLARRVRLLLSTFAIVLGVAFVTGILMFSDTLQRSFTALFNSTVGDTVVRPVTPDLEGGGPIVSSQTVPASLVPELAQLPGAARADGMVSATGVYVLSTEGKVVGGSGPPAFGGNWSNAPAGHDLEGLIIVDGHEPHGPDEVVLDENTADEAGYQLGDEVSIVTSTEALDVHPQLVGIAGFREGGSLNGATYAAFDTPTAQQLFLDGADAFNVIWVTAKDGVSQQELTDEASAVLPDGFEAVTGDDAAEESAGPLLSGIDFLTTFLLIFAGIALVVSSYIIVNTFSILVAQRSRELALLRALGASKRQVIRSVQLEAFAVGVIGSTLGLALGVLLAMGIRSLVATIGLDIAEQPLVFAPRTPIAAYATGIVVTMIAAWLPARRTGRIAPVQALRDDVALPESSVRRRLLLGIALLVLGVPLVLVGLFVPAAPHNGWWVGAGVLAVLLGVTAASPVIGRPFLRATGAVDAALFGPIGRLAGQNSLRNPRRTTATASALMIGLTLAFTVAILGSSAKASVDKAVEENFIGDYIVSSAFGEGYSPAITDRIAETEGVDSVLRERFGYGLFRGDGTPMVATGADSIDRFGLTMHSGRATDLADQTVLVEKEWADEHDLTTGDTFEVTVPTGPQQWQVVGVFEENPLIFAPVLTTVPTLLGAGFPDQDNYVVVFAADGAAGAALQERLDAVVADLPVVTVKDEQAFAAEQRAPIDRIIYIIYVLLIFAVVIAILGIVNTLALSVIERTREIGLLRAVGVSRRQLRLMIRLESVVIAVLGAVLGVGLGIAFGVTLMYALRDQGLERIDIPFGQLVVFLVLSLVIGVLAAVFPARRAARLDVLRAIATE
ncbi:MAG TPA: ABC transporter permease [Nocardioides bacterium]|uniref:ABC transporter permease n=1 Tax=uncultured Nocardioides sp. TaxID=198441 RepID=UPI000EE324A8|nr:ABC transporter permease [uncultured Nocardioides sp.]HCB06156.1 ABC transporter permease [Nocardioides sp.]HRD61667.1 ABC transporter permease [Nocardioides sp.]